MQKATNSATTFVTFIGHVCLSVHAKLWVKLSMFRVAAARKAATCAGETRPQVGNMAPKSGKLLQNASVTDESHSYLTPGLNSLVVTPEWLGCVYEGQ